MSKNSDLAKVHIAKKELGLDDETYRYVIRTIGKAESGSAKDLSPSGMARVISHFRQCGWKPKQKRGAPARRVSKYKHPDMASDGQIKMIRSIWITLAEHGVVRNSDEQALRTWIRSNTRRDHPDMAGYSAPEFLPADIAIRIIEKLKRWAARCDVQLEGC